MRLSKPKYHLGKLLRKLRKAANLTQKQLAQKTALSPGAVTLIERGRSPKPTLTTICLLADALEIPPHLLLDEYIKDRKKLAPKHGGKA
jgi:transcriptional regulator with XRE-family HTH domain